MVVQSPLSSAFKLESLPPTSTAAKFHSFRAYQTIQQWLGNELPPDLWGWQNRDATLIGLPVETDQSVAPMNILLCYLVDVNLDVVDHVDVEKEDFSVL